MPQQKIPFAGLSQNLMPMILRLAGERKTEQRRLKGQADITQAMTTFFQDEEVSPEERTAALAQMITGGAPVTGAMMQSLQKEEDLNPIFEKFGVGKDEAARVLYNTGGMNKQQVTQYLLKRSQKTGLKPEQMDVLLSMADIDGLQEVIGRDGKVYKPRDQLEAAIALRQEIGVGPAQQFLKQTRMFGGPEAMGALEQKTNAIRSMFEGPLGIEVEPKDLSDADWAVLDALGVNRKNIQDYAGDDIVSRRDVLDAVAQIEFPIFGSALPEANPIYRSFERWRTGKEAKKDDDKALDGVYHSTFDLQFNKETGNPHPLFARRLATANKLAAEAPSYKAADKLLDYAFRKENLEDVIKEIQGRIDAGTFALSGQEQDWLILNLRKVYGKRDRK